MKKIIKICAAATAAALLSGMLGVLSAAQNTESIDANSELSYTGASLSGWNSYQPQKDDIEINLLSASLTGAGVSETPVRLKQDDTLAFSVNCEDASTYKLLFSYSAPDLKKTDMQMVFALGDNEFLGTLPVLWADSSKKYETDLNGNEMVPGQTAVDGYVQDFIYNYRDINCAQLVLSLLPGENRFEIKNPSMSIDIQKIVLVKERASLSYKEYKQQQSTADSIKALNIVEGENYSLKSESYIRSGSSKNPSLYPHKSGKKCISLLDGGTWSSAGQKIIWEFPVEKSGCYQVAFHYSQFSDANKQAYRRIEIDGKLPFAEFDKVSFPSTQTNEFENYTLTDDSGAPFEIYLEKGLHTIALQVTLGDFENAYNDILQLMTSVNTIGMDLKKLSAGSVDTNRTWDMDVVYPAAVPELSAIADKIDNIYENLCGFSNVKPTYADGLVYAASSLRKLIDNPRVLPNKLELLNVGDNSVSKFLGDVLAKLISSPISIDRIYFSSGEQFPAEKTNFFTGIIEGITDFISSFTRDYTNYGVDTANNGANSLKVWVNRSVQYTETMQRLLDESFNKEHNTNIQLSIMPSEQKLILANASGTNPDVTLGIGYATPFNFAIRNSAKNLLEYDDFLSFYSSEYNLESLTPMCYGDGVYGAVETQDFNVLFYRKDIFEALGLSVPDTWDDVRYLMPTLLRNQMNFYIPLSAPTGYKGFAATTPFLFQNGAHILSDDGFSVAFDSNSAKKAFHEMIELYTVYGLQQAIPSFYNGFRYAQVPIGIGNMSVYLQLNYAAPELARMWDIAPAPGTLVDGKTVRYQSADVTACMIFKNTKQSDLAWAFLKWWLCSETQSEYAQALKATYGPEYFWSTANLKAFQELPLPEEHKNIIMEQWHWQKEVLYHPANYMIEREISNIWNNVVVNGMDFADAVDNAKVTCDREIVRKLQEFGYCNENGEKIKPYITDPLQILFAADKEDDK